MRWILLLTIVALATACGSGGGSNPPPPGQLRIDGVSPSSGPQAGGTPVSIRGAGFSGGVQAVRFGGSSATEVVVTSDNAISCITPAGSGGTVDVSVTTAEGTVTLPAGYTYNPRPQVFFVAPPAGYAGLTVSVVGFNFTADGAGPTSVFFGNEEADSVQVVNGTTIFCAVPPNPDGGVTDVTVVNDNGESTLRNGFVYLTGSFSAGRIAAPVELEGGVAAVLLADLETGLAEVHAAVETRGGGHTWERWGELFLPFLPDAGRENE